MADQKKSSFFGIGLAVGTVLGGLAAFFLSPKSGPKNREEAAKKFKELKKILEEKELDKKVKEIYGEVSQQSREAFLRVKDNLAEKLANLKERVEEIDREKYAAIVDDVVRELKKESKYGEKVTAKLKDQLQADWKKFTSA